MYKTGVQIQACTISKRVFGIAIIPHTEEAVVSLAESKIIQFANIKSMIPGRKLQVTIVNSSMFGITVVRDLIIIGGNSSYMYFIEKLMENILKL